jgi:hypothetical protein
MSVKIMVGGQMKVVADVITPGAIMKISSEWKIYSGSEWLTCDGSAISRTAYADLFAAISTTYGSGDGVNTFNIPTQAQANRLSVSVTSDHTFDPFTSDTDIVVNNPSAAYIDISDGAAGPGIRVSIIEQSAQGVTVYTDAAHTQSCLLKKGALALVWDGTSWVCESAHGDVSILLTSGTSFKIPFTGKWNLTLIGGGGSGGGATQGYGNTSGGGGGAGQRLTKQLYIAGGTTVTCQIGAGGTNTGHATGTGGGSTTATLGSMVLTALGGGAGGGGGYDPGSAGPGGAGVTNPYFDFQSAGFVGNAGTAGTGGKGGETEFGPGGAARTTSGDGNDAPADSYGAGGGGAHCDGGANRSGSSGTAGAIAAVPAP